MSIFVCDPYGSWCTTNWETIKSILIVLAVVFYFYPSAIASATDKKNTKAIFMTNLLFWWTWAVWLICLHVALQEPND